MLCHLVLVSIINIMLTLDVKCGAQSSAEHRGARNAEWGVAKIVNLCRRLTKGRAVWGSVCGPQPQRWHISTLSLNFKGEECDVCTSVYQPLVPSIFRLGLMSALQYDDKALDTVYYFIHQDCTLFTCAACSMSHPFTICVKVKNGHTWVLGQ